MDNLTRRGFLKGLLAAGVAPAVVRASSLMPINQLRWSVGETLIVPRRTIMSDLTMGALTLQLLDFDSDCYKIMLCGVEHTIQSTIFAPFAHG